VRRSQGSTGAVRCNALVISRSLSAVCRCPSTGPRSGGKWPAISGAGVVLPVPGGPYRMSEAAPEPLDQPAQRRARLRQMVPRTTSLVPPATSHPERRRRSQDGTATLRSAAPDSASQPCRLAATTIYCDPISRGNHARSADTRLGDGHGFVNCQAEESALRQNSHEEAAVEGDRSCVVLGV
jgi:hypothetical protein